MNRRQALIAAGGGLLVATSQKAQTPPITFDDISIDPSVISGYQGAMAQMVSFCQNNPGMTVPDGMVDNCINWSNLWTQAVAGSGLGDRINQALQPSDPNGLTGMTPSDAIVTDLQNRLSAVGVYLSTADLAAWLTTDFAGAIAANADFGGFTNSLSYIAGSILPLLYSATAANPLIQARRAVALSYRIGKRGPQPHDNTAACKGLNKADNLLSTVVLLSGAALILFPACSIICGAISASHAIPLATVKILKFVYSC